MVLNKHSNSLRYKNGSTVFDVPARGQCDNHEGDSRHLAGNPPSCDCVVIVIRPTTTCTVAEEYKTPTLADFSPMLAISLLRCTFLSYSVDFSHTLAEHLSCGAAQFLAEKRNMTVEIKFTSIGRGADPEFCNGGGGGR